MGQKIKPIGLRVGINRTWDSRWYAGRNYGELLHQDIELRSYLMDRLKQAAISRVVIERPAGRARVTIHAGRPGLIIGKKGQDIERLRADLSKKVGSEVSLNIVEVRKPEIDAKLIAENIAQQLERRVGFRRAMKRAVQSAMRLGAQGVRINCAGRLGGAEIARTDWYREGRVPLHTLRADVDYGFREARTTYGRIGVKVWLYKGDILPYKTQTEDKATLEAAMAAGETSGQSTKPRKVVSSAARKRVATPETEGADNEVDEEPAPLIKEADPEFERLLDEEDAIEASTREQSETPNFRAND